ncbi:MAG: hypothetical protein F6K40_01855 [Okeania sp. SIO3I5]|uniref:hypothetical protein n=1 Tax=Okeania sp. SIO3I5 TaxID=2607805 RepID=UPI0013BE798D|nr:hypothetical protein [Okeania sp. SIO3I5]NEQ35120.1 hypothetical protein [Okeania sp. SIO3I5]
MRKLKNIISGLLAILQPKSEKLEVETYGLTDSQFSPEKTEEIVGWLLKVLIKTGYIGKSYLVFDHGNEDWEDLMLKAILREEPMFLYRLNNRPSPSNTGCHWYLTEHPSLRLYKLHFEVN